MLKGWKGYFKGLLTEENMREKTLRCGAVENEEVRWISKDEARAPMETMTSGKALSSDNIPVKVWNV